MSHLKKMTPAELNDFYERKYRVESALFAKIIEDSVPKECEQADQRLKEKAKPILFTGPMAAKIFSGQKTETRRTGSRWVHVRKGQWLYVREPMALVLRPEGEKLLPLGMVNPAGITGLIKVNPSIHHPKERTRMLLKVTAEPRLEAVCQITEAEAEREGFKCRYDFMDYFLKLNPKAKPSDMVWVIQFEMVPV